MNAAPDMVFDCPKCHGPLITEVDKVGAQFDCPHCFQNVTVPRGKVVDKSRYIEPPGLRRMLAEVRDREWEALRRKHQVTRERVAELEKRLAATEELLKAKTQRLEEAARALMQNDTHTLRKQVQDLTAKLEQANRAFQAVQQQQTKTIEMLRTDLDKSRAEAAALAKALKAERERVQQLATTQKQAEPQGRQRHGRQRKSRAAA